MADKGIKKTREAICANRASLEEANDEQIRIIWDSLDSETQQQYLDSIKKKEKTDAVST